MRKITVLAIILCITSGAVSAQKPPKWLDKARRAVVTVETQDANGITKRGNGFFVSENGEAVSDYMLFEGATQAFVTDADGRKMAVTHILGADNMYDVVRFKVAVTAKMPFLETAANIPATGAEAYLLPFGLQKDALPAKGAIVDVSNIKSVYGYYKIDAPLTASQLSIPLLTADGKVFAMAQADASGKNMTYGISVPYIVSLHIGQTDVWNKTYSDIGIRKAWAQDPEEAQVALILYASQQDAKTYLETLNDFIATFPNISDGYNQRASHYAFHRNELADNDADRLQLLDRATDDMNTALKYATDEADEYYTYAKLIYNVATTDSVAKSEGWTLDKALEYLNKAIERDDRPIYRQMEGEIALSRGDYERAYLLYSLVNRTQYASPASFYLAAKARQQMPEANPAEVLALIDSAVAHSLPSESLPYLEESADLKMSMGMYEAAIKDYDKCYSLMAGNVSDAFYYLREQAKFRQGDLDGALSDISYAIRMQPDNAVYHAEMASIYLRKQDPAKAQECLERALENDPDFASSHRLLGVCYLRQEKKDEACKAFHRAEELGDPLVKKLIKDNCEQ